MGTSKICNICGGTTDGTPSGIKRHEATAKHQQTIVPVAEAGPITSDEQDFGEEVLGHLVEPARQPSGEAYTEANQRNHEWAGIVAAYAADVKKFEADVQWRQKRAPHLVPKYEAMAEQARAKLAEAQAQKDEQQVILDTLWHEQAEAQHRFWTSLTEELRSRFGAADIQISNSGNDRFEINLLTGEFKSYVDLGTGETVWYPETAFGFSATVSRLSAWLKAQPFAAGWGSFSGNDTIATNRAMLRILTLATDIAEALNEALGL